jgi:DinB family
VSRRGQRPAWVEHEEDTAALDELERRADETAQVWERFLSQPLEATKLITLDQGAYEAEPSVLVVQALHHGNAHREQLCAVLTGLGIEPPDLQPGRTPKPPATRGNDRRRPGSPSPMRPRLLQVVADYKHRALCKPQLVQVEIDRRGRNILE